MNQSNPNQSNPNQSNPNQSNQSYDVYDNDFKKIGVVQADNAEGALTAAKKRFPLVPAPMVQPTPVTPRAPRSIAPRKN